MNIALIISLMAVAISLFVVFIASRAVRARSSGGSDTGNSSYVDSSSTFLSPGWTADPSNMSADNGTCEASASGSWGDGSSGDSGSCDSGGGDGGGGD